METARLARQFVRYIAAILIAIVAGQIVQVVGAAFIDIVLGYEVTGGGWSVNLANVIVICVEGAAVGCVAGAIAQKRGMLISAIAIFVPLETLETFVLVELIKNRDISDQITLPTIYEFEPTLWTWIALIPAMISAHSFEMCFTGGPAHHGINSAKVKVPHQLDPAVFHEPLMMHLKRTQSTAAVEFIYARFRCHNNGAARSDLDA
jgi:hypothetical protein